MRRLLLVLLFSLWLAVSSTARESVVGHVDFFYFGSVEEEEAAIYDDFSWYLNSVAGWLEKQGIVVNFHNKAPLKIKLHQKEELVFNKRNLESDLGFIMLKPDSSYEIYYGVHTDVDIQYLANENFGLEGK